MPSLSLEKLIPGIGCPPPAEPMQYYGLLGDYVGGFWGTVVGAITLIVVLVTWWTARNTDLKSKTYQIFAEMLRTHEEIVSSIKVGGLEGRDSLQLVLSEFYFIYKVTRKLVPSDNDWDIRQRIDIAFTTVFFGLQLQTQQILSTYEQAKIQAVLNLVTHTRQKNDALQKPSEKRRFPGHQNRLSHYFRNLYNAYKFIEESSLSRKEKLALGQVLRAKLSNYEQALLALNTISHLGRQWENTGLLNQYRPIKNVPRDFFSFDPGFHLKRMFPKIQFEWETRHSL